MSDALPRRRDRSIDVLALIRESSHLISGRELNDHGEYDRKAFLAEQAREEAELERRASVREWAAIMLPRDLDTCCSILQRLPVRAGNLDAIVLRHALRGRGLPSANTYLPVTDAMLDAVAEVERTLVERANKR